MIPDILIGAIALAVGVIVTIILFQVYLRRKSNNIIKEAETEAEVIKKDKILQAKEKFLQLKSDHERAINERNQIILSSENKIRQRENELSGKIEDLNRKNKELDAIRENLGNQMDLIDRRTEELDRAHKQHHLLLLFAKPCHKVPLVPLPLMILCIAPCFQR